MSSYAILPSQQMGYTVNGFCRLVGHGYIEGGDEWSCGHGSYWCESIGTDITTPFGTLTVGATFTCSAPFVETDEANEGTPQPYVDLNWELKIGGNSVASGTTTLNYNRYAFCTMWDESSWLVPDIDLSIPFSLTITTDFAGYMQLVPLARAHGCGCQFSGDVDNLCGPLWCQYPTSKDPCGPLPRKGFCWLESAAAPTFHYSVSVKDDSRSGLATSGLSGTIINPGGLGITFTNNGDLIPAAYFDDNSIMGQVSFSSVGFSVPDLPNCTYTDVASSKTVGVLSGNTISLYRQGGDSEHASAITAGWDIDYGSYRHTYTGTPVYCDGQTVSGADCRVAEVIPQWDAINQRWSSDGQPASQPLGQFYYGGKWTLSFAGCTVTGPYVHTNYSDIIMDQTNLIDEGATYGECRYVGIGWVNNPGSLGQPDVTNSDPLCAYKDSRMLAPMSYSGMTWDALKLSVPTTKQCWAFNLTTTPQSSTYSQSVDLSAQAASAWGARFLKLNYTSNDSADSPISITIDGRTWSGITTTNNVIDTLHPDNAGSSGNDRSLIGTIHPQNATPGTSVPWDLGIYKLNTVVFSNLKANKTYTLGALQMIHKGQSDGGTLTVVIYPEAAWQDRDPTNDSTACDYAGRDSAKDQNAQVWTQACGQAYVDGALAGELIANRFKLVPDQNCGDSSTGNKWAVGQITCNDSKWACYTGEVPGFLTASALNAPAIASDNLMNYLAPGIYHGTWNGDSHEVALTAAIRLDLIEVPACWPNVSLALEKWYDGMSAVRAISTDNTYQPRSIKCTSGSRSFTIITDKWGLGLTEHVAQANALSTMFGNTQGAATIRNRKCSIIALKGTPSALSLKYCAGSGKLKIQSSGALALECTDC